MNPNIANHISPEAQQFLNNALLVQADAEEKLRAAELELGKAETVKSVVLATIARIYGLSPEDQITKDGEIIRKQAQIPTQCYSPAGPSSATVDSTYATSDSGYCSIHLP